MGKISRFVKAQAARKQPKMDPVAAKAGAAPVDLPPPPSEGEVPDAAPIAAPVQTSSTPKMVTASTRTMRKPIKD